MTVLKSDQQEPSTGDLDASPAQPKAPQFSFRPDIEGLRAVAVLLVVLGHAGVPFLAGGFVGVDVFFVISGFLITTLLVKELRKTGTISLRGFYARRATRLLPASALVVAATLVAAWLWLPYTRIESITGDALASSFYAINYRLADVGTDYFSADTPPSPLQHFWSLAVEEQFYFVWPLLLIATVIMWRGRRRYRQTPVAIALALILVGSFALSVTQSPVSASWSYFGIHTRAWELAAGALIAVFAAHTNRMPRLLASSLTWTGITMIVVAALTFDENTVFPGSAALLPVAGTALLIAAGTASGQLGAGLLLNRAPFQFIGKISYSFYLWHWPILMIAPMALERDPSLQFNLWAVSGALLITWITYHLVENPIRNRKTLKLKPWRGIGVGATLTAATATLAMLAAWVVPLTAFEGGDTVDTADVMEETGSDVDSLQDLIAESKDVTVVPANLTPSLIDAPEDRPAFYADGCGLSLEGEDVRNRICEYGDTTSSTTVVLFGDSHAGQWFPALEAIADKQGWKLIPLTRSGCTVSDIPIVHKQIDRRYTECDGWREAAYDIMDELDPNMVITTSINNHIPVGDDDLPLPEADQDPAWLQGWDNTFEELQARTDRVVYMVDTPHFGDPVADCVAANPEEIDTCFVNLDEAMLQPERTAQISRLAADRNITVVDPLEWFCVDNVCPAIIGNTLVIRDSNHVTSTYAKIIAPPLEAELPRLDH